jgi:hypothetical protein
MGTGHETWCVNEGPDDTKVSIVVKLRIMHDLLRNGHEGSRVSDNFKDS